MFRTSSFCKTDTPMCVEVDMSDPDVIRVRNSERPEVEVTFTPEEWRPFELGVILGEFHVRPREAEQA